MGTWGYKLYQDDITEDIKDEYVYLLRTGKSNCEATNQIIEEYSVLDSDEISLLWFALADTQWRHGRLIPEVKTTALELLHSGLDLMRWKFESPETYNKRAQELIDLEKRLLSPQPEPKKLKQFKFYKCPWKFGDVFAYCMDGEISEKTRFYKRYIYFIKIDERIWHPGHIIPIVYFFNIFSESIVDLEKLQSVGFMPQGFYPIVYMNEPNKKRLYRTALITTSSRVLPKKLIFLGNIPDIGLIKDEDLDTRNTVFWKDFEKNMLDNMEVWM